MALQKDMAYIDVQGADPEVGIQPCDRLQFVAPKPERLQVHLQHKSGIAARPGDMLPRQAVSNAWLSPTSQTPAEAQYLYCPGKALYNLHQVKTVGGWGKAPAACCFPKAPLVYLKLVLASSFKGSETTVMMQEPH